MKAKRITALLLTAVMSIGVLGGCGAKNVDADEVVVKMADGEEVRLGVANFMASAVQSKIGSFVLAVIQVVVAETATPPFAAASPQHNNFTGVFLSNHCVTYHKFSLLS